VNFQQVRVGDQVHATVIEETAVHVGKHRDLSNVGLGDSVRVQITEAVAISVVRP
jgi:hypothetical protein